MQGVDERVYFRSLNELIGGTPPSWTSWACTVQCNPEVVVMALWDWGGQVFALSLHPACEEHFKQNMRCSALCSRGEWNAACLAPTAEIRWPAG